MYREEQYVRGEIGLRNAQTQIPNALLPQCSTTSSICGAQMWACALNSAAHSVRWTDKGPRIILEKSIDFGRKRARNAMKIAQSLGGQDSKHILAH
jgi:hypothetical protein